MPLGGFAPLPLRLGGTRTDGITAQQWSRLAADLTAITRVATFAHLTYFNGVGVAAGPVTSYVAQHRDGVGLANPPTVTDTIGPSFSTVDVTWAESYEDDFGVPYPTNIRHAIATTDSVTGFVTVDIVAPNIVRVHPWDDSGTDRFGSVFLTVW